MVCLPQKKCPCLYLITYVTSSWTEQFDPKDHPHAQRTKEVICLLTQSKRGWRSCMETYSSSKRMHQKWGWDMHIRNPQWQLKICLVSVTCRLLWVIFFLSYLCSFFGHSLWPDTFFCRLPRRQSYLHWMWCPSHGGFLSPERICVLPVCLSGQPTSAAPEGHQPTPEAFCWTLCQVSAVSLQQLSGPVHE